MSDGRKKLFVSFSGGKTSAYMTWWLLNCWEQRDEYEIRVVFANTGKEVEETLFFIDECSVEWGIDVVWLEGYASDVGKGWSVNHKVVTYETAARNGEPFEAMIAKLGIPNLKAPFCSRQLKKETIKSYARSIGWNDYHIAIGIRVDEQDRVNANWIENKILYPLVFFNPTTKRQISEWWGKQSFDLNIHADYGNCDGCWKKSFPALVRIMNKTPKVFDWWQEMMDKYGHINPRTEGKQNFYRGNIDTFDIKKMAEMSQAELTQLSLFDVLDGCAVSCEVW